MAKTYLLLLFILIQSLDDSQAQSISGFTQGYVSNSETKLITGDYLTTDLENDALMIVPSILFFPEQGPITAVRSQLESEDLLIFPNPFQQSISLSQNIEGSLLIYDQTGKVVFEKCDSFIADPIELGSLSNGFYTAHITDRISNTTTILKIFKQ